jgi:hypothetical protein
MSVTNERESNRTWGYELMDTYITDDGVTVAKGDRAYNYYDMKPGVVGEQDSSFADWFTFNHDDGSRALLNGQRICSMAFARRRGFKGADALEGSC